MTILDRLNFLQALRTAGVDNWDGYDFAQDIYEENKPDELKIYVVYYKYYWNDFDCMKLVTGKTLHDVAIQIVGKYVPDVDEKSLLDYVKDLGYTTFKVLCVDAVIEELM